MDTDNFWNIVDKAKNAVGEVRSMPNWLIAYLKEQPETEIFEFYKRYCEVYDKAYDLRLWAAAELMCDMCSDDKFTDFLGWLIANGKKVYELALLNPDTLADVDDSSGDDSKASAFYMFGVAVKAYRQKVGDKLADLPISHKAPALLNENFWDGDLEKLEMVFPNLYRKYRRAR